MSAVLAMPAGEYRGWERHFRRWPPGDTLTQRLLAELCALVANAGFALKRPARAADFAPWLEGPEEREKEMLRREAERTGREAQRRVDLALLVEKAYRKKP